jgi:hypothetical protein
LAALTDTDRRGERGRVMPTGVYVVVVAVGNLTYSKLLNVESWRIVILLLVH